MPKLPWVWGDAPAHARPYPADDLVPDGVRLTRSVRVAAPSAVVYRWLGQLAVAPYSYDLIDNRGRRSPRELTPGTEEIEVGATMIVFEVTSVEPGSSWTGRSTPAATRLFGRFAATYAAEPDGEAGCLLVCRIVVGHGRGPAAVKGYLLAWGDLVMMRKQLLTLKRYAERDAARAKS
ncbi:MAG: SRPBCC family protein [Marmoricola sp.]